MGYLISHHNIILFFAHRLLSYQRLLRFNIDIKEKLQIHLMLFIIIASIIKNYLAKGSSESSKLVLILWEAIDGKRKMCGIEMRVLDLNKVNRTRSTIKNGLSRNLVCLKTITQFFVEIFSSFDNSSEAFCAILLSWKPTLEDISQ